MPGPGGGFNNGIIASGNVPGAVSNTNVGSVTSESSIVDSIIDSTVDSTVDSGVDSGSSDFANTLVDYFGGLFTSVGAENAINRAFNSAEAEATRNFNANQAEINRAFNSAEAAAARDFSAQQAAINRIFNADEAQKNRDFQASMSNTAYQRSMEDMKKAGLNPILMAAGGFSASSPSGSSASGSSAGSFSASGSAASGPSASYNSGGGDTLSGLITSISNAAKGLSSLISSVGGLFKPGFLK